MKKVFFIVLLLLSLSGMAMAGNTPELSLEINLPECLLKVYSGGQFLFAAPVGIGKTGHETPTGDFTVVTKVMNPTWYPKDKVPVPPGPTNPLGSFWLGLSIPGYGIHGNIQPTSIGTPVSLGCIRMHNDDIQAMYYLVDKGCKVKITYRTVVLMGRGDDLGVKIFPDVYNYGTTDLVHFLQAVNDLENKNDIFIPYVIYLMKDMKEGSFQIPWKVNLEYSGQIIQNIAFKQGNTTYIDPFALATMTDNEYGMEEFLKGRSSRYVPLEEVQKKLVHHRIVEITPKHFILEPLI